LSLNLSLSKEVKQKISMAFREKKRTSLNTGCVGIEIDKNVWPEVTTM